MRLPRSLHWRLVVLVLGVMSAVWLAAAAVIWIDAQHELDELLDGHLAQAAALLVAQQSISENEDHETIDAPSLHPYAPKVVFQVWHDDVLALRSANAPAQPMSHRRRGFATLAIDGIAWRVFAARGAESDTQVYVGEQIASRAGILWAVMRSALWPMAVALPLLAVLGWWAVRQGLLPMRRLSQIIARREAHVLAPVAVADAPTEMQPLITSLNGLFERIAALLESERRFTADAAHELRTPIAAIRVQAQTALITVDDAPRRHALQATLAGCDRAAHLVEQLLLLSRLEQTAAPPAAAVDLSTLTRQVVAELANTALEQKQSLELAAPESCLVVGDDALLAVLVRNLVDNAIRYSSREARIRIAVAKEDGRVRLNVEDSGPGMSEEQLARLGERFFRVLGSDQAGSGLGWSIVRRIGAATGAAIEVRRSDALGGLRVVVTWS